MSINVKIKETNQSDDIFQHISDTLKEPVVLEAKLSFPCEHQEAFGRYKATNWVEDCINSYMVTLLLYLHSLRDFFPWTHSEIRRKAFDGSEMGW